MQYYKQISFQLQLSTNYSTYNSFYRIPSYIIYIYKIMERKKTSKLNYALPQIQNGSLQNQKYSTHQQVIEPCIQAPFMKYASSIIEVISQDNLESHSKNQIQFNNKQPIYEISQVKIFQINQSRPQKQTQTSYNQIAAKMKKKPAINKQILVYNFTNIAILHEKIDKITKDKIQNAFKLISSVSQYKKSAQIIYKSTPKKSSFHSGYTSSTSNQQNVFKKQKRKQNMKESANQIKGWIEFKVLIILNESFKQIFEHTKKISKNIDFKINKNKDGFFDTLNNLEISLSKNIANIGHHIQQSFIYTVENISDYAPEKELSITTPERFSKKQDYLSSFEIKYKPSENKSKDLILHSKPPKSKGNIYFDKIIEHKPVQIAINIPIEIENNNDRKYLIARTNCYQLPIIADYDVRIEKKMQVKLNVLSHDKFHRNQSQINTDFTENNKNQIDKIKDLFKSNKNIKDQYDTNHFKAGYTSNLSTKIFSSKNQTTQKILNKNGFDSLDLKKAQPIVQVKKIQNYYFPDKNNTNNYSNKQIFKDDKNQYHFFLKDTYKNNILTKEDYLSEKNNNFEQIKSIESIINVVNQQLGRQREGLKIKEQYGYLNNKGGLYTQRNNLNSYLIPKQQQKINKLKTQINQNHPYSHNQQNHYYHSKDKPYQPNTFNQYQSPNRHQQNHYQNIYELSKKVEPNKVKQLKGQNAVNGNQNNNIYQVVSQKNIKSNYGLFLQKHHINNPIINSIRKNSNSNANHYLVEKNVKSPEPRITSPTTNYPNSKQKQRKMVGKMGVNGNYPGHNLYKRQQSKQKYTYFSPQIKKQVYPQQIQRPQRVISKIQYNQQKQKNQQVTYHTEKLDTHKITYPQERHDRLISKIQYNQNNNNYHQSPQVHQYRNKVENNYYMNTDKNRPEIKAINYNNNYYTTSAQKQQQFIHIEQGKKLIPQGQLQRPNSKIIFTEKSPSRPFTRPPSCRDSIERVNPFNNYSPIDSELQSNQKSYSSSRHISQLNRPKSMNEKIHITLRRQR